MSVSVAHLALVHADDEARRLIERDSVEAHDLAREHGQILDNVKHMEWFVRALALRILSNP